MGHSNAPSGSLIWPVRAGTGTTALAPPWARAQVRWLGKGFYILRLATDETSRWLFGAGFRWSDVLPHERTFRRSAEDKCALMQSLKMNPWPAHLAIGVDPVSWRRQLSTAVEAKSPVFDTGHVTLWRVNQLSRSFLSEFSSARPLVVLDGHHSRKAQRQYGLPRVFGWAEPLEASQLQVRPIERAGKLAKWIDACVQSGEFKVLAHAPNLEDWRAENSWAFEVVQADKRFWCELARPSAPDETVVDALTRLGKGNVFLRTSSSFDEILDWLQKMEIDTALRLPPPSKAFVRTRAMSHRLFPQKATYFYPKVPFGLLVEDLKG